MATGSIVVGRSHPAVHTAGLSNPQAVPAVWQVASLNVLALAKVFYERHHFVGVRRQGAGRVEVALRRAEESVPDRRGRQAVDDSLQPEK